MQVLSTMGVDRQTHAAIVANAKSRWQGFESLHKQSFAEQGFKKYKVIDEKGNIINSAITPSEAKALITNAAHSVRHEDYLVIQDTIVEIRRRALNGIADLRANSLTFNESIEKQLVGFERATKFNEAKQSMNPNTTSNNDTNFTEDLVPCPITHLGFSVPWRQSGFNYKQSLGMSESIRLVAERLEKTLFVGNTKIAVAYNGESKGLYGYTTHPKRGTGNISDWTISTNYGKIHTELNTQLGLMFSAQSGVMNGRVMVYVANDIWQALQEDYKAESEKTIMERCKAIAQVMDIKPAEYLPNGEVVLVEMERRSVELCIESDIVVIPHTKTEVFQPQAFTAYAAMTHHIKDDADGNTGIRHLTTS